MNNFVLAQGDSGGAAALVPMIILLLITIAFILGMWKLFEKAGKPGWAAIIPIYNIIVALEIAGKPVWWIILFCIPIVNLIVSILFWIALAEAFGKSALYGIALLFFWPILLPILGFSGAKYVGAKA